MNPLQKRKAVSPVIATVILVAVAITVAVGVSYWMGGISAQYTQFEKVEISTGYSVVVAGPPSGWTVLMSLKNSGSATATITHVFVNDVPVNGYAAGGITVGQIHTSIAVDGLTLTAGDSADVVIYVSSTAGTLSAGTTVNIKLHSAGGMDYIKLVRLT
jgi:flagellin-like protein